MEHNIKVNFTLVNIEIKQLGEPVQVIITEWNTTGLLTKIDVSGIDLNYYVHVSFE